MQSLSKRDKEKQLREKEIVAAAERVFCRFGYEAAGMDEIAKEAQYTKRTVYQYFENKDELYFAVVLRIYGKLMDKVHEANKKIPAGYDKLEQICKTYFRFYRENPVLVRLLSSRNHIRQNSELTGKNSTELFRQERAVVGEISEIIEEGKDDGSILPGIDSEKTAMCLMLLLSGFYDQAAFFDKNSGEDRAAADPSELESHMIEILMKPLKKNKAVMMTRKGTA